MTTQHMQRQSRATRSSQVVVFDFDHTLYDGDSFSHLLRWLIGRSVWRSALALLASPLLAPLVYQLRTRHTAIRAYIWIATVQFRQVFDLNQAVNAFVSAQQVGIRRRLLSQGLGCLTAHCQAGDDVVIATGAPVELAHAILALVGLSDLAVLGTQIHFHRWRLCALRHCHHRQKVTMLTEAGFRPIAFAYSDSVADLPLLKAARQPVVVNPKKTQIAAFVQHLPAGTPILNWGCRRRGGQHTSVDS